MTTSAVPALIDALFDAATAALPDLQVYDGMGVSDDPGDFLMIGVDDPDEEGGRRRFAGYSSQEWANANYTARDESGDITCAALSWNGDGDQKAARTAAYTTVAAVENLCRANPSLGVANLLWTSFGSNVELSQAQDSKGALALVIFSIHFRARL